MTNLSDQMREVFLSGKTQDVHFRMSQLDAMADMIRALKDEYLDRQVTEFGKSRTESYDLDVFYTDHELGYIIKNLKHWVKPTKVKTDPIYMFDKTYLYPEAKGVVLIYGAWNYPLQMVLIPLAGAIAAGCCAVIKPSEIASSTSRIINTYLNKYLDPECYRVVEGGPAIAEELLDQRWDHIFYTGSTKIGKEVARKAATYLTPVTLELGGKSPAIVDETCHIANAAKRIAWGKLINAGATCISPDYLLVQKSVKQELIKNLISSIEEMYTEDPKQSPDYVRIVNQRHYDRLEGLLAEGNVLYGGQTDRKERYISPTLLANVSLQSDIMQQEVFGPILPIFEYDTLPDILPRLKRQEKPLVVYHFSTDNRKIQRVEKEISAGTYSVNDTISFVCVPQLPFGGVGNSGQGRYHGKATFDTFTNYKSVMKRPAGLEIFNKVRYPPYLPSRAKDLVYSLAFYRSDSRTKSKLKLATLSVATVAAAFYLNYKRLNTPC